MKNELELILKVEQQGPPEQDRAFAELAAIHRSYLLKYIERRVSDRHDAEELCWDALLKLFNWLAAQKRTYGNSVRPILIKMANDLISNYRRRKSIFQYMDDLGLGKAEIPEALYHIEEGFLNRLLAELSDKERKTIELFEAGYNHQEIAESVGWANPDSSKAQLNKIRKFLRRKLRELKDIL